MKQPRKTGFSFHALLFKALHCPTPRLPAHLQNSLFYDQMAEGILPTRRQRLAKYLYSYPGVAKAPNYYLVPPTAGARHLKAGQVSVVVLHYLGKDAWCERFTAQMMSKSLAGTSIAKGIVPASTGSKPARLDQRASSANTT